VTAHVLDAPEPVVGAGEMLAGARAELGMTVEDVAEELRLSPRQIVALERNDYSQLPGTTYVRGYLRNYARLVGLSIDKVVPPMASAMPAPADETVSEVSPRGQRQVSSRDRHVRMISYLLAGVLAGLMVVWWQSREAPQLETLGGRPPATQTQEAPIETIDPDAMQQHLPPEPVAAVERQETKQLAPIQQTEDSAAGGEPAVAEPEGAVLRSADGGTAPPVGQTRLSLRYSENCWTEIRDARGKRLAYDTVAAGTTLYLDGVPPFQIYFANAKAVSLQYNGRPYDLSSHIRRGFARFELGGPVAEH